MSECKECDSAVKRERYLRDREKIIAKQRFYTHGITGEQYQSMFESQSGLCAICGRPETLIRNGRVQSLSVDHNHDTGIIRDLLCAGCNVMIGHAMEDPEILRRAALYLERHALRKAS